MDVDIVDVDDVVDVVDIIDIVDDFEVVDFVDSINIVIEPAFDDKVDELATQCHKCAYILITYFVICLFIAALVWIVIFIRSASPL